MIDEEGEISTRRVKVFINGKPEAIEALDLMKSTDEGIASCAS
jgi:photosystem II protein